MMRILWVKIGGLWPANTGGRLRSLNIIAALSRLHSVTLLTTHGPGDDPEGLRAHLGDRVRVESFPHSAPKLGTAGLVPALVRSWTSPLPLDLHRHRVARLQAAADALMLKGDVDLCIADFLHAAPNVSWNTPVPVVLFEHNVEHVIWKRLGAVAGNPLRRAVLEFEWRKMRQFEIETCSRAAMTLAVSDADRRLLATLAPLARVQAIPTGVDVDHFAPAPVEEVPNRIVFTGSMDWYPNEDAVLHFIDRILPVLRRRIPDVSLTVVGRNPSRRLRHAADAADVTVTGTVDDVRPHVARAAVCVVPLRIGGGTRLKIFEALAMGKAVVSTTIGAEGLPIEAGKHFLEANDPDDFAATVIGLLRNRRRRIRLGCEGRQLMVRRYSWERVAETFSAQCMEAMTDHAN